MARKTKRMRLPNGFGQISEIRNRNLRKPFRAMVTVGFKENGRPICKTLKPQGYFETYNDAYAALIKYHEEPYAEYSDMTMNELFEKWTEEHFKTVRSYSTQKNILSSWRYCESLYNTKVRDIRPRHLKYCIEEGFVINRDVKVMATENVKRRIKANFNGMFDYAVEYEIVERNIARDLVLKPGKKTTLAEPAHMSFTDEEISILWENSEDPFVQLILIECYSGWRPVEMGTLTVDNTNITDWTFTGGVKTRNGRNRTVPIHSKIREFVASKYDEAVRIGSDYLFNMKMGYNNEYDNFVSYAKYKYRFNKTIKALGLNEKHSPHDCRKHFVTIAKKYDVDEYAIKRMVGHSIQDLTERVYTDRSIEWLRSEIEKIR